MSVMSNYTGKSRIKRYDSEYGASYYVQIARKSKDGKWKDANKRIKFKQGVEFEDGQEIELIKAFETFSTNPNTGKPIFHIFCAEYKLLEKTGKKYKSEESEPTYEDTFGTTPELPF